MLVAVQVVEHDYLQVKIIHIAASQILIIDALRQEREAIQYLLYLQNVGQGFQ